MATGPNPKYDAQSAYNKHQGCENETKKDCSCCPPGLIAIYDCDGIHAGCLTPNDAEAYNNSKIKCQEGYVKTFHPTTGDFIGCLAPADAISIINLYIS